MENEIEGLTAQSGSAADRAASEFAEGGPATPSVRPAAIRDARRGLALRVLVFVFLASVIWVAQFWRSSEFGLYEDDWAFIGQPMGWTWSKVVAWAIGSFQSWWLQGRPVGFAATAVSVFWANRAAGLEGVYIFASLLHVINAYLVFALARQRLSLAPAFCAALGFALLPSDTSVPLLTNGLFMGFATLFLLVALWLYQRGFSGAAYLFSLGSLLTFESAFLPFFAAPLLREWDHKLPRRLLKHWIGLLMIGGLTFWLRSRLGEAKTSAVLADGPLGTLNRVATAVFRGPLTTLQSSVDRALVVLNAADRQALVILAVLAVGLTAVLFRSSIRSSDGVRTWSMSLAALRYKCQIAISADEQTAGAIQTFICGVTMLIMAYGLAISSDTYPPVTLAGRLSGCTHMAAATGFGFIVGACVALLLDLAAKFHLRPLAAAAVGLYLGMLGAFHYVVQRDFVASWRMQQAFWRSVVKECPDLQNGTVLLFEDYSHPLRFVETNSWADPLVLASLYRFPATWSNPPQLFPVTQTWRSGVIERNGSLVLPSPFGAWPDRTLTDRNVILLKSDGAGVRRITGSTLIGARELRLKPSEHEAGQLRGDGPLYRYVM